MSNSMILKQFMSLIAVSSCFSMAFAQEKLPGIVWSDSVIETDEEGTSVLIIPMDGQMNTDIHSSVYKELLDEIKDLKPDLLLVEIMNIDWRNKFDRAMQWGDTAEFNIYNKDDVVSLAEMFHVDLGDIEQVVWVKDSSGTSTPLALSWPTLYMSSEAWLRSSTQVWQGFMTIKAADTHGKIREATVAHGKAFATWGDRDWPLIRAFLDPAASLYGTWEGKKVIWTEEKEGSDFTSDFTIDPGLGPNGEFIMPNFDATTAMELAFSKGTIWDRNDLLLAEGIREYHIVGEDITQKIIDHKEEWRQAFDKASETWLDSTQYATWAVGEYAARYLREQLQSVKRVKRIMDDSPAVAMRMGWKHRIDVDALEELIKQIEEQLEQLKKGNSRPGGGGGRGPIGGGGG